jgi:hypothetical protein
MGNIPLYGRNGKVVAFLLDGRRIVSLNGQSVAWLQASNIYDYRGHHLGFWDGDHARGHDGGVALWIPGASTGLLHPIPGIPPIPPIPSIEPIRPIPELPPLRPIPSLSWSNSRFFS